MTAYAEVASDCAREAERVLFGAHAYDLFAADGKGEDFDGEFYGVADDDEGGGGEMLSALIGEVLEEREACATHLSAVGAAGRHVYASGDDDEVGVG